MSDEPSSSTAAPSATPRDADDGEENSAGPKAPEEEVVDWRKKNKQVVSKKRNELLSDLLTSIDVIVYAQLSAIYYMDCSFLRFLFRSVIHFLLLTPKPPAFPERSRDRPVIGALLFSNFVCFALHLWLHAPVAGEATRGYLHGGLVMDFIGQRGPTSKFHLLLLDVVVLALQLVQMSTDATRKSLKFVLPPSDLAAQRPDGQSANTPATTSQDLDAEERGVRRSQEGDYIELLDLNPDGSTLADEPSASETMRDTDDSDERHALISANTQPRDDSHIFDAFNSGQIVIADLNIADHVAEQYRRWRSPPTEQLSDLERQQSTMLGADLANRMFRMRFGNGALRRAL